MSFEQTLGHQRGPVWRLIINNSNQPIPADEQVEIHDGWIQVGHSGGHLGVHVGRFNQKLLIIIVKTSSTDVETTVKNVAIKNNFDGIRISPNLQPLQSANLVPHKADDPE